MSDGFGGSDDNSFALLGGAVRDAAFMDVEREIRRLQTRQALRIARVHTSGSFTDDQYHTSTNWLCAVTNTSKIDAARRVRVARMLADLDLVASAAARGELGMEQLALFAHLHGNERCRAVLPQFEAFLVDSARQFVLHDFRQICQRLEQGADPDGTNRDIAASRANRHVSATAVGAGFRHVVEGDAVTGEVINEIIKAHAEAEFHADVAARLAEWGADAEAHPLARSHAQRMYDAFYEICLKASATTETSTAVPLVVLFSTPESLRAAIQAYFDAEADAVGFDPADPGESIRLSMCETSAGAPVDPIELARAAILGEVQHVISDPTGRTINLGRKSRLFRGAAKDAVLLSGDRCNGPGCLGRHHGIQIDHCQPWRYGGRTDQGNAGPKCPRCNRAKERGRFTVIRDDTGWHHHRPDGTEIAPRWTP